MHKTPLFISGIGRSGTSAVISSLAKHKSVVEPDRIGEAPIINHFINFLIDYEDKSPDRDYHFKNYQLDSAGRDAAFSNLLSSLQYGVDINATDAEKSIWIAKVSLGEEAYRKACSIFSQLRVIYVMRNGIEVVNSAKSFHGFASMTFEQLCRRWANNLETCRYVHSSALCAVIKHHELVTDPKSVYQSVYEQLQMEADEAPANFIGTTLFNSSFDKTASVKSTSGVFDNRLACWDDWSKEEQNTFVDICDDHMIEFDFQRPYTASYVPKAPSVVETTRPNTSLNAKTASTKIKHTTESHMTLGQLDYYANASAKFQYLFIENPKVASTSILKELQQREDQTIAKVMANPHVRTASPIPRLSEYSLEEQDRFFESNEIFRFTFARNPFTRLLSAYLSKIDKPLKPKAEILAIIKGVSPADIVDLKEVVSFPEFVDAVCSQESAKMNSHWRAQVDQIMVKNINYDFIGRFEQLEDGFKHVMRTIYGIDNPELTQSKNKTGSGTRLHEYYTDDLIDKIYTKFYDDFNAFEYSKMEALKVSA